VTLKGSRHHRGMFSNISRDTAIALAVQSIGVLTAIVSLLTLSRGGSIFLDSGALTYLIGCYLVARAQPRVDDHEALADHKLRASLEA
jgi:uncharacterized membrane protein